MSELRKKKPLPKLQPFPTESMNQNGFGTPSLSQATLQVATPGIAPDAAGQTQLDSTVAVTLKSGEIIVIKPDELLVTEQLGQGQYGIVERVRHKESGSDFAVKRVALRPGDDNEHRRLLMDVDVLVKGTECVNIIRFYGALIWEGDLWILMELMDCSLDKFYKLAHKHQAAVQPSDATNAPAIPETVLGRMAADIVNALQYLYSMKVIHRDIKPSNILINRGGIIKLCDFGISGYLVNSVAMTYEAGCRQYMAPERIDPPRDRTGYDIKSDVWSFGVTMLEIATGQYPYARTRNIFEQLTAICSGEPPRLPANGQFSGRFADFIERCLQKDYNLRPKYDLLLAHPFIEHNRDVQIGEFSEKVISFASQQH